MPSVLICGTANGELSETILWRDDIERRLARQREDALALAAGTRFDLIVVHDDFPEASLLIRDLRSDEVTRGQSIAVVVLMRDEFEPGDLELIDAGANAILRAPVSPEWDQRLGALMRVPPRRAGRFPIELRVETSVASAPSILAGTALNLSEHGMLLETDVPVRLGSDLDFWIYLRDAVTPLRGCGQIVRQDGPSRGGVRFFALEADGLARIRRFVGGERP